MKSYETKFLVTRKERTYNYKAIAILEIFGEYSPSQKQIDLAEKLIINFKKNILKQNMILKNKKNSN